MNDPHLIALHYELELGEDIDFVAPPSPLVFAILDFDCVLDGKELRAAPRQHVATRDDARRVVDPRLTAWQVEAGTRLGFPNLRLVYKRSEMVDRAPDRLALFAEGTVTAVGNV